jgi:hypothetical protein
MDLKTVITLILGLVFQLAQVLPGAVATAPCQTVSTSCECCEGAESCDCAANGDSNQRPSPAPLESGNLLKVPAARSVGTHVSADLPRETQPSAIAAVLPETAPSIGYTGIRLSVAFCTFVI